MPRNIDFGNNIGLLLQLFKKVFSNVIKKPMRYLFEIKAVLINKAVLIKYEKFTEKIPNTKVGYLDIDEVEKRYSQHVKSFNLENEIKAGSVKDNLYFIDKECANLFKNGEALSILDVGCGSGVYSKIFSRQGSGTENWKYSGTEINEALVKLCNKYFPGSDFFLSTSDQIKSIDNKYNVLMSSGVLHYTLYSWKESLKEMARVSKKYILVTRFPLTKYYDTFYVRQTVQSFSGVETHYFICVNRREFEDFLNNCGLMIIKRDYSSEEYNIEGMSEKIILNQYLLEKK